MQNVSSQTQNELIEVMGKHMILQNIVNDIKFSQFYSILTDNSNITQCRVFGHMCPVL